MHRCRGIDAQDAADGRSRGRAASLRVAATALITVLAGLAYATDWDSPLRTALTLAFLLAGPGSAIAEALEIRDPLLHVALAIGLSLALEALVAVTLLYLGLFSAEAAFAIVVGVTAAALVVVVARSMRGNIAADRHTGPAAS